MAEELPLFGVYLRESGIKNAKTGLRGGVALEFKNYDEAVKFLGFLKQKGLDCKNANLTRGKGNRKIKLADATLMVDKKTIFLTTENALKILEDDFRIEVKNIARIDDIPTALFGPEKGK